MASTLQKSEDLYTAALRQGQVKHAVKTAAACCVAALISYYLRLPNGQFAPLFAFLIMGLGMPAPRLNWLLTLIAIALSASVSAVILLLFHNAIFTFIAVTLLWIFTVLLFTNWFPLPATLGSMIAGLGIFTFSQATVGDTLRFYWAYWLSWLVGGFCMVVVYTFLWPWNTRKVFLQRLAAVYALLEDHARRAAAGLRSDEAITAENLPDDWAPFRALRQTVAPELVRGGKTSNPFAPLILACRSLTLRFWFLNRNIAPATAGLLLPEIRLSLAEMCDRCADRLRALLQSALQASAMHGRAEVVDDRPILVISDGAGRSGGQVDRQSQFVARVSLQLLARMVQGLRDVTAAHNALLTNLRAGLAGELRSLWPDTTGRPLVDRRSVRSGTKLVLILAMLLMEQQLLGFPGGAQVAFFAAFFASTGNLGRQNKTDLVGLVGLLASFVYGIVAAFLTSRMPHFPLVLALVFLGQFVSMLVYQKLPQYSAAGFQAGLALPFALLSTPGPEFGGFAAVRTRLAGIVVAGATAIIVHAYLWPVLPMRHLRASIASALQATAASLVELFGPNRPEWQGAPGILHDTITTARDLMDDARYLPGPEHADPAYEDVLRELREIDANLEYIHFLVGLEEEHPFRAHFFQMFSAYVAEAKANLEKVSRQFQQRTTRAARIEAVRWKPNAKALWEQALETAPVPRADIDPWRPAVIAHCLDQIAQAIESASRIVREINVRNLGR
jgi:uncharacterized membrane protein YccC